MARATHRFESISSATRSQKATPKIQTAIAMIMAITPRLPDEAWGDRGISDPPRGDGTTRGWYAASSTEVGIKEEKVSLVKQGGGAWAGACVRRD